MFWGTISKATKAVLAAGLVAGIAGCQTAERLKEINKPPLLTPIESPTAHPGYRPVTMPMPQPQPARFSSNSLWRNGARSFFKDQRASRVGDILTVVVDIKDKAEIESETTRDRSAEEKFGFNALFGLKKLADKVLPSGIVTSNLVDVSSSGKSDGEGSIDREEKVNTRMAAVVTQLLPNGNMVIEGRQEVRVNQEKREVLVAGVVRPEDITSDNTISVSKIAEARVSYGGRGRITDVQNPRWGQQVLDTVMPF